MIKEIIIERFEGGISDDIRQNTSNSFALSQHFDIFSPNKLKPYRGHVDDGIVDTEGIQNFLYYGTTMYGYGNISAAVDRPKIFEKIDPPTGVWTASTTAEASTGLRYTNAFVQYKGYLYGWSGGANLWRYQVSTSTFTSTYQAITFTAVAQGIVGLKDDVLYLPYNNKIATIDNTTFVAASLTLPTTDVITQVAEYGNYIAIAVKPSSVSPKSKVYLWDRVSSDVTEVIDWGEGTLAVLGNIEGRLVGVSIVGGGSTFSINPKIVIKMYSGGTPEIIKTISDTSITVSGNGLVNGDKFYFMVSSTNFNGVFVVGRTSSSYNYAVTIDRSFNNDTAISSPTNIFIIGDYLFVAYGSNGNERVVRTVNGTAATNFLATSIYESQKFRSDGNAQLLKTRVECVALPTDGQIVLKYRKDAETSWTTIFTNTTDNSVGHTGNNIESSGIALPQFKEIQFRIESTGGAEITKLKFKMKELTTLYDGQ